MGFLPQPGGLRRKADHLKHHLKPVGKHASLSELEGQPSVGRLGNKPRASSQGWATILQRSASLGPRGLRESSHQHIRNV